jgi:hypothetical protein
MNTIFVIFDNLWNCIESVHSTKERAKIRLEAIRNDDINQDYEIQEWVIDYV